MFLGSFDDYFNPPSDEDYQEYYNEANDIVSDIDKVYSKLYKELDELANLMSSYCQDEDFSFREEYENITNSSEVPTTVLDALDWYF